MPNLLGICFLIVPVFYLKVQLDELINLFVEH